MMYELTAAFMMGLLGSMHCIGMCGGLVGALTMSRPKLWWSGLMSYQAGRVLTYSLLGLMAGVIGAGLHSMAWFEHIQRAVIVLAGIMMIAFGLNLGGWLPDPFSKAASRIIASLGIGRLISSAAGSDKSVNWAVVGMMNGLLPCGLVYAALTLSLASGGVVESGMMMMAFGIGTIPAMTFVPVLVRKITPNSRGVILKIAAILVIVLGVMMMLRGTDWMRQMMHGGMNHGAMQHSQTMDQMPTSQNMADHSSMQHPQH